MCLEINESDHKPVFADLVVRLPAQDQAGARAASIEALLPASSSGMDSSRAGGELQLSHGQVAVPAGGGGGSMVSVRSPCEEAAVAFVVTGEGGAGLPPWLEVSPAAGVLSAGDTLHLRLRASQCVKWGPASGGCMLQVVAAPLGVQGSKAWARCRAAGLHVSMQ